MMIAIIIMNVCSVSLKRSKISRIFDDILLKVFCIVHPLIMNLFLK
jgi:hypothetical protein